MILDEKFIALSIATKGEIYDHEHKGGTWMHHAVETAETFDHWIDASRGWKECSPLKRGEIAGLPFIAWKNTQVRRGAPRTSYSIIDFGDIRVAVATDLTNY